MQLVIDNAHPLCRDSLLYVCCLLKNIPSLSSLPAATSFSMRSYSAVRPLLEAKCISSPLEFSLVRRLNMLDFHVVRNWIPARYMSKESFELKTENDVVRFSMGRIVDNNGSQTKGRVKTKRVKMSKKAKLNELRFYRLKAKKKMTSPNPEVRIRYKLEKVGHYSIYFCSF